MRKIKLLVSIAGANFSYEPGTELSVSDEECERMVKRGAAQEIQTNAVKPTRSKAASKSGE